jgi:hypothetical protein
MATANLSSLCVWDIIQEYKLNPAFLKRWSGLLCATFHWYVKLKFTYRQNTGAIQFVLQFLITQRYGLISQKRVSEQPLWIKALVAVGPEMLHFYWCVGLGVEVIHICAKGLRRTSSLLFNGLRELLSLGKTAVTRSWPLTSIRCQVKNAWSIHPLPPTYLYESFLWPTYAHFINIKMLKLTIKTFV